MAYHLTIDNLTEITDLSVMQQKPGSPTMFVQKKIGGIGKFSTTSTMLPNIHILDIAAELQQNLVMENDVMGETVDINFHLQGTLDSHFQHIGPLQMRTARHNLLFSPEISQHEMGSKQPLRMFHVSLQKSFFSEMIGCEDAWSEKMQNNLVRQEAFKASEHQLEVTPVMQQLIYSIQNYHWQGSIKMLQLQSKMYELLALQLEQFKTPAGNSVGLSIADIEKLEGVKHYLEQHFLEELSLTGLCRIAVLNEFKLKKGFKQLFGTTVFGYVKTLQMEYAGRLLKERKPVEEVAYTLGYEHVQHFSTSFKKFWGSSPSGWGR